MSVILDHSGPNTDQDLGKVCILWMNRSTGEIEVGVENRSTNQTVVSRKDTNTAKTQGTSQEVWHDGTDVRRVEITEAMSDNYYESPTGG